MTKYYGLADECYEKFNEDMKDPNSIYQRINKVFDFLPLAAVCEDRILCMHGFIGQSLRSIEEIDMIPRPLEIFHDPKSVYTKIALELLWSDPVQYQDEQENSLNTDHEPLGNYKIQRIGFQRIDKFMNENAISLIIRSNEPLMDGVDNMGSIISVFSNTDYCGVTSNNASLL